MTMAAFSSHDSFLFPARPSPTAGAAVEICGLQYEANILSARLRVVEGFSVQTLVRVSGCSGHGPGSPEQEQRSLPTPGHCYHTAEFAFKAAPRRGEAAPTARGLSARLLMHVDLCSIGANSSLRLDDPDIATESPRVGQRRRGRGGRLRVPGDVQDLRRGLRGAGSVPANFSFLEAFPGCFGNASVVRSQGVCASAWAFASASAISASLCASSPHAATGAQGWQVSVQQLLSCNPSMRGCDGGTAAEAAEALQAAGGIAPDGEGSLRYACGGGEGAGAGAAEALVFTQRGRACLAWPWGGRCMSAEVHPDWVYGGLRRVVGESLMMQALVEGHALYCSFEVHESFLLYDGGMFANASGRRLGGHAGVCLGYGSAFADVSLGDGTEFALQKYWVLQNSWGAGWGNDGFGMFKRGVNLCGIEEGAVYFLAHVNSTAHDKDILQTPERQVSSPKLGASASAGAGGMFRGNGLDLAFLLTALVVVLLTAVLAWRHVRGGRQEKSRGAPAHHYEPVPPDAPEAGAADAAKSTWTPPQLRRSNATVEAELADPE